MNDTVLIVPEKAAAAITGATPAVAYNAENAVKDAIAFYEVLKKYAMHEDSLINYRLTWGLVISSFLFTGLAVATQRFEVISTEPAFELFGYSIDIYFSLALLFSSVGIASGFFCFIGIQAARKALRNLGTTWRDIKPHLAGGRLVAALPDILGAGDDWAHLWGMRYPKLVSALLIVAWFAVLIFNVVALIHRNASP